MADAVPPAAPGSAPALPPGAGLRPGAVVPTVVRADTQGIFVSLGGQRVPVPPDAGLLPGQTVIARVVTEAGTTRVRLDPPAGAPSATAAAAPPLQALARLLPTLGAAPLPPGFERAVPRALPHLDAPLRQWLSVLLLRDSPGADFARLAILARDAARAGAVPPALAEPLARAFAGAFDGGASAFRGLLARWAGARPAEAWLAQGGPPPDDGLDPRALIARLLGHEPFRAHLRGAGLMAEFEALAARAADHALGGAWQNLRGLEQPYLFLALPLPPDSGFRHAQIHVFPDAEATKRGAPGSHLLVLDCATTRLGDLWVTLRTHGAACQVEFRAARPGARAALEAAVPELETALAATGLGPVAVRVETAGTGRIEALAALMARFSGGSWEA